MSTSDAMSHDEAISQFCGVTGADEDRAKGLLEACEWNLELAINMHVDTDPEGRSNRTAQQQQQPQQQQQEQQQQSTSSSASATANLDDPSFSRPTHRNNVLIDDGDDEDNIGADRRGGRFASRYNHSSNPAVRRFGAGTSSAAEAATAAAYSNLIPDSDGVRPPIAPVRQILNPNPIGYPAPELPQVARRYNTRTGPNVSNVYDAFRDFQAEAQWQEMMQEGEAEVNGSESRRTLQELFRPPLELMFRGAFTSARESGTSQNRWLLVNIQNGREFACQVLNRDVWSHQTVKDIIREHFIFWQVYHDSYEGQRYVQFYHVTKLPHVAIIDPRTGELMRSWPTSIDHNSFCDSVIEFLTEHPSPDGSTPDANTMKKLRVEEDKLDNATLYDQSEEAQLEAAIKASLQEPAKVDITDDTIEIDDDTIEASDVSDPDKDEVEVSPVLAAEVLKTISADRPVKIDGPECRIALRFPDGSSHVQKFSASEPLERVKEFVQLGKSTFRSSKIEFVAPPNRKLTESMMKETLESLGLCPASRLEVKCVQD